MGPKKEKKGFQASNQFKPSTATLNAFQMRGAASRRPSPPSGAPRSPPGPRRRPPAAPPPPPADGVPSAGRARTASLWRR